MTTKTSRALLLMLLLAAAVPQAQVSFERLMRADREPQNWLTYSGTMQSQRFSQLTQITPENVKNLELQWIFQARSLEKFETTALVVDGIMYTVQAPNDLAGARRHDRPDLLDVFVSCRRRSRVRAAAASIAASRFLATRCSWARSTDISSPWTRRTDVRSGTLRSRAPRPGTRSRTRRSSSRTRSSSARLAASSASAGSSPRSTRRAGRKSGASTRFRDRARPATKPGRGDSWKRGGGSIWVTGSYDPDLNLTYWGIGNAGPDYNGDVAPRRQPLHLVGGGARRRHGQTEVALSVFASRRVRLRRRTGPGPRRDRLERRLAQGDDVCQPQRVLLRARSRDGAVPAR